MRTGIVVGCGLLAMGVASVSAQRVSDRPAPADGMQMDVATGRASGEMAEAAHNFWAALTPDQQAKASFSFDDTKERTNWHFIPRTRKGITWNDMDPAQQKLAQAFLASGLSSHGYQKAVTIMSLDAILKEMEQGRGPLRDPNNYAFSVFGAPGPKATWGWRVEGHHLSVNFTISDGHAVAGPVFFGSNPAEVRQGPRKGLRVLAREEDLGFELISSLTDDQKKKAIVNGKAPNEIVTSNKVKADPGPQVGIPVGELTGPQKQLVLALLQDYAHRLRPELAEEDLSRIEKGGLDKVYFAWEGAQKPGEGHYYRLHGPTFLVEFDNTQNNANHIHSVWRDSANDFGEDLLKEHYQATKHGNNPDH
jgi:hypothetical protein